MAEDIYARYRELRETAPVHVIEASGGCRYALHRYEHVRAAFKDQRFAAARAPRSLTKTMRLFGLASMAEVVESGILVALDPPDHTRLRRVVDRFFRLSSVMRLENQIKTEAQRLVDAMPPFGEIDLIERFAAPLPTRVITRLFGFPPEDSDKLKAWSDCIAPLIDTDLQRASLLRGVRAYRHFRRHATAAMQARHREPRDDLLSALAHARYVTGELTDAEACGTCTFVLAAGHETATHVIGTGVHALLTHPEQLEMLRSRPELTEAAVEESLRFESPIQRTGRVLKDDVEIGATTIPKGARMRLVIGAANRDPRRFDEPDRFDVSRADNRHLALAAGPHHCLGASLARVEVRVALAALLERYASLRLASDRLSWVKGNKFRGLRRLDLEVAEA